MIKHECGIALLRLLKPLSWYHQKYGTWMYGINKLYLLMEKQHNRGQEAAGVACVKIDALPGNEYIFRERATGSGAIRDVFAMLHKQFKGVSKSNLADPEYALNNLPFAGNLYMGHLRYSTTGRSGMSYVHPFLRRSNWKNKSLLLEGNFNLTNVDELFHGLVNQGQHPRKYADTYIMLETMGHALDCKVEELYHIYKESAANGQALNELIEKNMNLAEVLREASRNWDGGYAICGCTGTGTSFTFRDPWGIRSAFWYKDDEIEVVASERPVIQTVFNVPAEKVIELLPGQGLVFHKDGRMETPQIHEPKTVKACSFERIYFSRGSDKDIYRERKALGKALVPEILQAIHKDLEHTVFSFIPNTAEVAFYGMKEGLDQYLNEEKAIRIMEAGGNLSSGELHNILSKKIRMEKVAIKDIKLRTFITEDKSRDELTAHVYDITYESIVPGVDNLVVIDDSIVRGTTLKQSIIKILDRLEPRKIVIVSSSPQVRYPDCYGIDMSRMEEFIAFKAAVALLKESGRTAVLESVYLKALRQRNQPKQDLKNYVREIYEPFTPEEISEQIVKMLTPENIKAEVEIVYQSIDGLHKAIPNHKGDWYFSGEYPTPGGYKAVNEAFINFYEGVNQRPV